MVDLTADTEEEMDEAPATPPPNVSDSEGDMDTDEEGISSPITASTPATTASSMLEHQHQRPQGSKL